MCSVPEPMFRTICSAVDKLDKEPWDKVRGEMVDEKGLDAAAADCIGEYVKLRCEQGFHSCSSGCTIFVMLV